MEQSVDVLQHTSSEIKCSFALFQKDRSRVSVQRWPAHQEALMVCYIDCWLICWGQILPAFNLHII